MAGSRQKPQLVARRPTFDTNVLTAATLPRPPPRSRGGTASRDRGGTGHVTTHITVEARHATSHPLDLTVPLWELQRHDDALHVNRSCLADRASRKLRSALQHRDQHDDRLGAGRLAERAAHGLPSGGRQANQRASGCRHKSPSLPREILKRRTSFSSPDGVLVRTHKRKKKRSARRTPTLPRYLAALALALAPAGARARRTSRSDAAPSLPRAL